jgi:hypothetical protein
MASSSPEEKLVSLRSSESSTISALAICFFFVEARDGEGAIGPDSSGASENSHPGYSPSSG